MNGPVPGAAHWHRRGRGRGRPSHRVTPRRRAPPRRRGPARSAVGRRGRDCQSECQCRVCTQCRGALSHCARAGGRGRGRRQAGPQWRRRRM
eukprot:711752-Hanusia_phi.AAC.2